MGFIARLSVLALILCRSVLGAVISTIYDGCALLKYLLSFGLLSGCSPIVSSSYGLEISLCWFRDMMKGIRVVEDIQLKSMQSSRGRSSDSTYEGYISFREDGDNQQPLRVILKCSQNGLYGRFKANVRSLFREGLVYESHLFRDKENKRLLNHPRIYVNTYSNLLCESVLLMEDLRANKGGIFASDILGSLKCPQKVDKSERDYLLHILVKLLARLHSTYWNKTELLHQPQYYYLSGHGYYKCLYDRSNLHIDESKYYFGIQIAKMKWRRGLERIERNRREWLNKDSTGLNLENSIEFPLEISPQVITYINSSLGHSTFSNFLSSIRRRPSSLCHGDVHGDNIFVTNMNSNKQIQRGNNNFDSSIYFFDLQEVGIYDPASDISNLVLANCINQHGDTHADTQALLEAIARLYYEEIIQHGVSSYTFHECLRSFYITGLEKFAWIFCLFLGEEESYQLPLVQYVHNILSFIIDHCEFRAITPMRPMILT